jgi:hypothetical protein
MKYDEPLGLPKGSVRAIIAILVVAGFVLSIWFSYNSEVLASLASMVATFYFLERKVETTGQAESGTVVESAGGAEEEEMGPVISGDKLAEE